MPLSLGPPAQTPCLIYLCIYPLSTNSKTGPQNTPKVQLGTRGKGREKEEWGGGERNRERGRERVTCAQWELTKHLVIKSILTFW